MSIGSKIRAYRNKAGITQIELSNKTNIEQTIISRYENGVIIPPIPKLEKIAKSLNVSIAKLIDDNAQEKEIGA